MAAEAIKTSEEQLKIALWGSGSEMWKFDLATRLIERESYLDLPDVPLKQVLPLDEMLALMPVEDRKSFLRAFDGEADSTEVHYRVRGGSGSWHWLQSRGRVLKRDARGKAVSINGITFDVTKIKDSEAALRMLNAELSQRIAEVEQARAELAASESRRSMALWGTGCEYFEVDLTRQLIMRENALPYLAASGEETDVQSYYGYLHPDDRGRFVQAFVDHVKGLSDHYAVVYRAASTQGDWIWIQTRGRILERAADGWVLKIAGTNYDITELKQREMEARSANEMLEARVAERTQALTQANGKLSETLEELRQMQSELVQREKMAALGGLVAGVAHEIRTPLGIGVTAASHMQDLSAKFTRSMSSGTLTRSETEGFLEDLQQASSLVLSNLRRASDLISSFKQVAVDQSSEQRRVINLKRYMDEILTSLRPAFKHKQFKLNLSCPDQLEFDTYPGAIYQVMVNLVMNSIHHGLLEREQGAIDIDISVHADWVRWQHKDDGVGMNAETCKRIFEPFFTTQRGKGGSGLGMHIVFNLVTQVLKGHIEARSEIGCGTTITIQFPIAGLERTPAPVSEKG
jgi:signal transduction histidine kinase